jgi:uncharacterized protein YukE
MGKIDQFASQIDQLKGQLDTEVNNLLNIWSGTDANQFVSATWPPFKQQLTTIVTSLQQLSTSGKNQAQAQVATSAS